MENNQLIDISSLSPAAIELVRRFGADILEAARLTVDEYNRTFSDWHKRGTAHPYYFEMKMSRERFLNSSVKVFSGQYAERATRISKREIIAAFGEQE